MSKPLFHSGKLSRFGKVWVAMTAMSAVGAILILSAGLPGAAWAGRALQAGEPMTPEAAGYKVESLQLSASEPEGPALAADPTSPVLYATLGGYGPHKIVRVQFDDASATVTLFSTGAWRMTPGAPGETGDNLLDSRFGSVFGMVVLMDGSLLIVDNNQDPSGRGDTIYRAVDLNGDGDARDVVLVSGQPTSETRVLINPPAGLTPPGSGWGGFSGVQAECGPDGTAYIITADGGGQGEVLAVDHPTSPSGVSARLFYPGLEYGSGLAFDSDGRLLAGNVDYWAGIYSILRLKDLDHDGSAADPGESEVLSSGTLSGIYDLAVSADDDIFLTSGNQVLRLNPETGQAAAFASHASPWAFLGDLAFVEKANGFAPFSGPGAARLAVSDTNGDGKILLFTPSAPPPAEVADWMLLR